jgi:hypothetical protein
VAKKKAMIGRMKSAAVLPHESCHKQYTVEILGRRFPVTDMVQASSRVDSIRDQTGMGASEMGAQFPIRDGASIIGYVSYNGRVWAGHPKDSGTDRVHLVYDPDEKAHRDAYAVPESVTTARVVRNNPGGRCDLHEERSDCVRDPSSCRWAGCDYTSLQGEPVCKTPPRHYDDTKSFFCQEHRQQFLREHRWDDRRGEWVERR